MKLHEDKIKSWAENVDEVPLEVKEFIKAMNQKINLAYEVLRRCPTIGKNQDLLS